jgi:hypothetical protein
MRISTHSHKLLGALFKQRRRGSLVQEAIVAIALSGVVLAGISQLLGLAAQQRHAAQQRFVARHELDNWMESAMSLPWDQLTAEGLATAQLSELAHHRLPQAELHIKAVDENENTRRVHVQLSWLTRDSEQHQRLSLVGWRYKPIEAQP